MRRNAKIDANQPEIVKGLRKIGATVLITAVLKNCFDLLIGYRGINYIMEVKDGKLPPSRKRLTDGEQEFKDNWRGGPYYVVESLEQAIEIITEL